MIKLCFIPLLIIFCLQGFCQTLDVKKFGAMGDGKTDDTKAIQAAINAAPNSPESVVYFPDGTYLIKSYTITHNYLENFCVRIHSGITFKGNGKNSIIKLADHIFDSRDTMANAHIFYGVNIDNIQFTGLLFDLNGAENLVPENILKNHMAIFVDNGSNIKISDITIKNCSGSNMIAIKGVGHGLQIKNSFFYNGGNYVGIPTANKYQVDFSFIYSEWDSTIVTDNHIEQQDVDIALSNYSGGVELHGSYCYGGHNTIIGCNPAFYVSSSWHPMEKTTVADNDIKQCLRGISFWVRHPFNNITISNNNIGLTYCRLQKNVVINGIEVPNGNAMEYSLAMANNAALSNVLISGNTITADVPDTSKDKTVGLILHSLQNSRIENNTITGMNYAGIILMGSKWGMKSVSFSKNTLKDFKVNNDLNAVGGYVVVTDTYSPTNKNAPGIKDIHFSKNNFTRSQARSFKAVTNQPAGKFFGAFVALPSATINEIHFDKNVFSDDTEKILSVKTD